MPAQKPYTRRVDNRMRDFGRIDLDKREISVNKRKGGVLDTIVHEETHRRHPRMSEKVVRQKTTQSLKTMSPRTKTTHYSRYR
jgi:hypothetical protein